nr:NAD(P)-dependent oxidoreductase [uncultured Amphritea sp.]
MRVAAIFGGAGFIGCHFTNYLLENKIVEQVVIYDLVPINPKKIGGVYSEIYKAGFIKFERTDVRNKIISEPEGDIVLIANFAAVHREPGHNSEEYYETNLKGAENVCQWAEKVGCEKIIFTSSIAPYGPTEEPKTELSIPVPVSAYGGSKLAAEKIHETWQACDKKNRKLVIARPGVVYGPGENGNVTRMIKALRKKYFFYMGNRNTRKAGTYVKELCNAMWWVLDKKCDNGNVLFNMSMNPGPTIEEYVDVISEVYNNKKYIPSIPYFLMLTAAYIIDPISKLIGVNQPISPVRIKKLVRSNNIIASKLKELGYEYKYTLESSMKDWALDNARDWGLSNE